MSDVTFSEIHAANGGGTLYLSHLIGTFKLTNVTFDSISSDTLSCGIHGDWGQDDSYDGSSEKSTYVHLVDSTVTNCDCGNFIYAVSA